MGEEWQKARAGSTVRRKKRWPMVGMILAAIVSAAGGASRALADDACTARPVEVQGVESTGDLRLRDGTLIALSGVELPAGDARTLAEIADLTGRGDVSLAGEGPSDRYHRIHATVMLAGGLSLQWKLVAGGLARVRVLPGEHPCGENLLDAEKAARIGHLGLWAGHEYAIWRADDPSLPGQIGLYALVQGRVVSVGAGSRIVFLDFGRNWRHDFTVMVAASEADRFAAAGKKLESLANRTIRVRGVVEENNGPAIRVDSPDAIEVLDGDVQ
jgi:hypothetical protein